MGRVGKVLIPLVTILLTLAGAEGISRWILAIRPGLLHPEPPPAISSPFALPQSLTQMPTFEPKPGGMEKFHFVDDYPMLHDANPWVPPPNKTAIVHYTDTETGKVEWEVEATTDASGRRIPPWQKAREKTAKRHIFAAGCSLTWGRGVSDAETFLARISERSPDLITYNAGVEGYSIAEILVRARHTNVMENILPADGIGIYVVFNDHIRRFLNATSVLGTWRETEVDLRETSPGNFESTNRLVPVSDLWLAFSRLWTKSAFGALSGLDLPLITDARMDRFTRAIKAYREDYRRKTKPTNPFVVVLFPMGQDDNILRAALHRAELPYLDYGFTDLNPYTQNYSQIVGDGHPTAEAHKIFSIPLERDLRAVMDGNSTPAR